VRLSKAKVLAKLPTACTVDSVVIGRIKGRGVVRSVEAFCGLSKTTVLGAIFASTVRDS
jgi:hypothetical protein